jgi:hypothetical protein
MNREEAERERERMATDNPDVTWLVAEQEPGDWAVVKVGLVPGDSNAVETTEERPRPPTADDPRTAQQQNVPFPGN